MDQDPSYVVEPGRRQFPSELPEGGRQMTKGADVRIIEGQLKEARAGKFTILCDEPPELGGEDRHPQPLTYIAAGVGF